MLQKTFRMAGTLLLAGAALFAMPGHGQAQHGGGHGGGGGHFGGFSGARVGGFGGLGGPVAGARLGGYAVGTLRSGPFISGTHGNDRAYYGRGYGYRGRPYYGGYGYYGGAGYSSFNYPYADYYSGYYSAPYSGDSLYADSYDDVNPSDYVGGTVAGSATYQSFYSPSDGMDGADNRAHFTVKTPADATLWFNGVATKTTGTVRNFDSPPLQPGSHYNYEVWARWNDNGHEVTQRQEVKFTPGENVNLMFPLLSGTSQQTSAVNRADR
jgi:uncharacterized protein (TIGR03000 family)